LRYIFGRTTFGGATRFRDAAFGQQAHFSGTHPWSGAVRERRHQRPSLFRGRYLQAEKPVSISEVTFNDALFPSATFSGEANFAGVDSAASFSPMQAGPS
jgi:hypothetical protein